MFKQFHKAIVRQNLNLVEKLLGSTANWKQFSGTLINLAVRKSNEAIVKMLLEAEANVNVSGITPLHIAVCRSDRNIVKLLLDFNADTNAQDIDGLTALHFALTKPDEAIVMMLLYSKADVQIKSFFGETPLNIALINSQLTHAKPVLALCVLNCVSINWDDMGLKIEDLAYFQSCWKECHAELDRIKVCKVGDSRITYFYFLKNDLNKVAGYLKNESILKYLQSEAYLENFPIYAPFIKLKLERSIIRKDLIVQAYKGFATLQNTHRLPTQNILHILSYFTNHELKKFISCF